MATQAANKAWERGWAAEETQINVCHTTFVVFNVLAQLIYVCTHATPTLFLCYIVQIFRILLNIYNHMEGKITKIWLANEEGISFLIHCKNYLILMGWNVSCQLEQNIKSIHNKVSLINKVLYIKSTFWAKLVGGGRIRDNHTCFYTC